jgi:drug/metabolite transporter (DMT)-like permease
MTRRGLILFGSLGVAWGIPYLFIKIAVGELAPEVVVLSRSALAAILLLPLAAFRHEIAPVMRRWRPMLVYTVVEMVIPWYLLSSAETRLPSSTTGLLIAAVPLAGIAVAWALGKPTQFRGWNWVGIAVGMAGVGALVGFDVHGSNLSAVAEVAVVVVGYAIGPAILAHWVPELPGIGVTAVSLAAVAVIYAPVVALRGSWPTAWPSAGVVTSIVVLAVVCSALAFVMMIALIGEIGPVRSTAITYVNPAVAVFAGVLFLSERLTVWKVLGLALVLGGSALATRHRAIPAVPLDPTVDEAVAATGR